MLSKVTLANTDLQVSQLCYGTNMLGWNLDQDRSNAILNKFAALGGNFVDSARSYGDWMPDAPKGASERAIGAWLKTQKREDVVVATKGGFFDMRVGDYRNRVNPTDIASDLNESLDHLGVDAIDLYWLHMDNPETPVAELIDFLNEQKAAALIAKPPQALAATRRLMRGDRTPILQRIDDEAQLFRERLESAEAQAAFAAFFDKRAP